MSGARIARSARGGENLSVQGDVTPLGDYVLLKLGKPEEMSKGGLAMPASKKPQEGIVVSTGPGSIAPSTGEPVPVSLSPGSSVMYSESAYFDTFDIEGVEHALLREAEILLSWSGDGGLALSGITMPRGKALVLVQEAKQETSSGLLLSKGAAGGDSKVGLVLATGEGEVDADGKSRDPGFAKGDLVRFYYEEDVKLSSLGDGRQKFKVVRISSCMGKAKPAEDGVPEWTTIGA